MEAINKDEIVALLKEVINESVESHPLSNEEVEWVRLAIQEQVRRAKFRQAVKKCLAITDRQYVYTSDPKSWTELPYDIGSIAAWKLGLLDEAVLLIKKAIEYNPLDERLSNNLKLILDYGNA